MGVITIVMRCLGGVSRKYQTKKLVQEEQQAGCGSFEFRG